MKAEKKKHGLLIVSLILLLMSGSLMAAAAAGAPGSEDDPVVTKSYVDSAIASLRASLSGAGTGASGGGEWQVVCVPGGKSVVGETGTQMILRSGTATAIDNGANGISDLTGGSDLRQGAAVSKNHLLLIPGSDGRGIRTAGECWVMISGGYALQ